ncbi:aminotransferase class I/II-fold pyridoxal phosphate-dependent enzyme [Aggregicoccus sp. 17bor-14]|uniref:DegT/DnrJ/EryC1/StrS family aminotransferase n=1 Tax=Myxococcaceae TaxID=31 RepID=UPI00129CC57C|nr:MULTISPECIES: aminotransferase class I/II-fold pyridoxal phosphate-dependent enzyme [Myxococcaceae]MBF5043461.1 aminotransferase class I/II-fold pyridoxal phosphate-dependent enzyme [Simulacricoccus sp. 17bor-14]MRI89219.1 aminotransferase class I/II-fold pyridoxal phosphate-dependent enzyme [Aggregicoccus sp. 17bor-14]
MPPRLHLSPPHLGPHERGLVSDALESNWVAPLGPHVEAFQEEFAQAVGAPHALALSSGTAALHLALEGVGVGPGDEVVVSTLTFAASVNPIRYLGARPFFVDSEPGSWNMDPALLAELLQERARAGRLPRAVVLVHLYGQCADLDPIAEACERHGVALVEDAAEALGSSYRGRPAGTRGRVGVFSFNGNKIITTSGGGMLVSADGALVRRALKLSTQAREPAAHYEHTEVGYNYRLSNVLAAIGRGQLRVLEERVEARRRNFARYAEALGDLPGLAFMPEAPWGRHTRWLTTLTLDPARAGADREAVRLALERENIEARPVWKPMHLQPVFSGCGVKGGAVSEALFRDGLCLPSGSSLTPEEVARVAGLVRAAVPGRAGRARTPARALPGSPPA